MILSGPASNLFRWIESVISMLLKITIELRCAYNLTDTIRKAQLERGMEAEKKPKLAQYSVQPINSIPKSY